MRIFGIMVVHAHTMPRKLYFFAAGLKVGPRQHRELLPSPSHPLTLSAPAPSPIQNSNTSRNHPQIRPSLDTSRTFRPRKLELVSDSERLGGTRVHQGQSRNRGESSGKIPILPQSCLRPDPERLKRSRRESSEVLLIRSGRTLQHDVREHCPSTLARLVFFRHKSAKIKLRGSESELTQVRSEFIPMSPGSNPSV